MPNHLGHPPNDPAYRPYLHVGKDRLTLCKITVEVVKDKLGRTIQKKVTEDMRK